MSKGIDLIKSMDHNNDWLQYSDKEARRKTDYEKQLEEAINDQRFSLALHKRIAETYRVQRKLLTITTCVLAILLVLK